MHPASKLVHPSSKHAHTKSSVRVPYVWVCSTYQAAFAPNFGFELPPYFLNNARAIATLEGMALSADPSFDVLKVVYPFALRRLLADPRGSPLLRQTLPSLTRDARGVPDLGRLRALLLDSAALSGRSRTAIMLDAALTPSDAANLASVCPRPGPTPLTTITLSFNNMVLFLNKSSKRANYLRDIPVT